MQNYETLIMKQLDGETPKEKYEHLLLMEKTIGRFRSKATYVQDGLQSLLDTPDTASLGNLKTFIEGFKKALEI